MTAIISHCGRYRYQLGRSVSDSLSLCDGTVAFFGINPSRAGAVINDQSILKMMGFARLMGAEILEVGNVFAYRSTDVRELANVDDPVGPCNEQHLADIIERADTLVPCWGRRSKVPATLRPRIDAVSAMLLASGKPVRVLGLTACGSPRHPLMLAYATPLVAWVR